MVRVFEQNPAFPVLVECIAGMLSLEELDIYLGGIRGAKAREKELVDYVREQTGKRMVQRGDDLQRFVIVRRRWHWEKTQEHK